VSLRNRVAAHAKEAKELGRQRLGDLKDRASEARPLETAIVSVAVGAGRPVAKALGRGAGATRDAMLNRVGGTSGGAALGNAVRRLGGEYSRLPLISLASDVAKGKNSVMKLTESVRANPSDLSANLWLAEALKALERDMGLYTLARTVSSPHSVVTRQLVKGAAALGAASSESPSDRMLRRTYALASVRLRHSGYDAEALHVIARIYLTRGQPDVAVKPAKLALAQPDTVVRPLILTTLARTYMVLGHAESARRAAELAIDAGCTVGFQVLADLEYYNPGPEWNRKLARKRFVDYTDRVTRYDALSYYGTYRSPWTMARFVMVDQLGKTADGVKKIRTGWAKARKRELSGKSSSPREERSALDTAPESASDLDDV
jgi:hypothetical protein